jgi:hypothetical protein
MRYTGEENKAERQAAAQNLQDVWGKMRGAFGSDRGSKDEADKS